MREEFKHHIALRTEDLMRQGIARNEASRKAHIEFGHVETHRERARAARGLHLVDQVRFSWIDVRLGLRMLVKHPLLASVAVFALAVGIPVGMAPAHLANAIEAPLPEDTGNRIRAIRFWDPVRTNTAVAQYGDYEFWLRQLTTFSELGAFRSSSFNVASDDGRAALVAGAQVSASVFDILERRALMGRVLDAADDVRGAPDVVVIGYDLWATRFGSDPGIVGETIALGTVSHTVVGVMPEGFLFPLNEQLWLPLRNEPTGVEGTQQGVVMGQAVRVGVFGRLADGVTDEEAQAEVSATHPPTRTELAEDRELLDAEVVPFGMLFLGLPRGGLSSVPGFYVFQILALVLLLVACGNVAMLVFARTATRFRELAIRTALGASRARVVTQIFVETLVMALLAASVGVFAIDWILGHVNIAAVAGEPALPYWFTLDVTGSAIVWALVLAAVSATVAGVIPAVRITSPKIQQSIQRVQAGRSGIRFGGVTGALIVADVAISMAVVGLAFTLADQMTYMKASDELAGIPAAEFLAVELRMPTNVLGIDTEASRGRFAERLASVQRVLVERLQEEPGIRSVAVADVLPRMDHRSRPVEVDGDDRPNGSPGWYVRTARVDVDFFDALSQPVLAGRTFTLSDVAGGAPVAIVNTVFVDRILGGRDAIGRRVRFTNSGGSGPESQWREIVGVVGHLGVNMVNPEGDEALYVPAAPGTIHPVWLGIHANVPPEGLAPRVRELASEVDPNILLGAPVVLSDVYQGDWYIMAGVAGGLVVLVGVLVTLAASGIYAIMSFSVSERTREIGIRTALGASRFSLVLTILRRSLLQIGIGALLGLPIAGRILLQLNGSLGRGNSAILALVTALVLAGGLVCIVGLLSCLLPARRVLGIQATEALRADA